MKKRKIRILEHCWQDDNIAIASATCQRNGLSAKDHLHGRRPVVIPFFLNSSIVHSKPMRLCLLLYCVDWMYHTVTVVMNEDVKSVKFCFLRTQHLQFNLF